ncbi:hypothetical protein MNBD_GAMMA12-1155 [hydrothermal vent metagenome]|uniref:Uncharacterized protein n=1 Tax=hydrothermal vent metagenome TaxID=652676 RepID=A0A3B0Z2Y3_9ZZZZ
MATLDNIADMQKMGTDCSYVLNKIISKVALLKKQVKSGLLTETEAKQILIKS